MNIKEFSKISGISSYTLRYYEKIGIFQEIRRDTNGHRDFTEKDLLWAEFINRLKETGMPLEQIKEYALLRQQGESTENARKNLLEDHASVLKNKISEEKKHLSKIKEKIKYYEENILVKRNP
jgi:DNA-binding transcriptional MerR regulator